MFKKIFLTTLIIAITCNIIFILYHSSDYQQTNSKHKKLTVKTVEIQEENHNTVSKLITKLSNVITSEDVEFLDLSLSENYLKEFKERYLNQFKTLYPDTDFHDQSVIGTMELLNNDGYSMSTVSKFIIFTGKDILTKDEMTEANLLSYQRSDAFLEENDNMLPLSDEETDSLHLSETLIDSTDIPYHQLSFTPIIIDNILQETNYEFKGVIYSDEIHYSPSDEMNEIHFVYQNDDDYLHIAQERLNAGHYNLFYEDDSLIYLNDEYIGKYLPTISPTGKNTYILEFATERMNFTLHTTKNDKTHLISIAEALIKEKNLSTQSHMK